MMVTKNDVNEFDAHFFNLLRVTTVDELYEHCPNFQKVVNSFSAKILKELFEQYKVGSYIDFNDVAKKIHTGETSIGSILAKIKNLRTRKEETKVIKKGDDLEKDLVKDLRAKPPKQVIKTDVIKIRPKTARTMIIKKEPVKLNRPKVLVTKLAKKTPKITIKNKTVNDDVILDAYENNAPFIRRVMMETVGLLDNQDSKDEFIRGYIDVFGDDRIKRMIGDHGGDIQKLISSIGWHVFQMKFKGKPEFKKTTKKGFFEIFEINSRSCHRSLEKVENTLA